MSNLVVHRISKQAGEGLTAQAAWQLRSEPAAQPLQWERAVTTLLFPLLLLFFRPDLRRRAQQQHLAEALRSEYASGLEAGGAKAKKQSRQAEPGDELGEPSSASSSSDA